MAFLMAERKEASDPLFLVELCHYEWVPMYIDRLYEHMPERVECTEPLDAKLALSPVAKVHRYVWPVADISEANQPQEPPKEATWVLSYRDRENRVYQRTVPKFVGSFIGNLSSFESVREAANTVFTEEFMQHEDSSLELRNIVDTYLDVGVLVVVREGTDST